MATIAIGAGMRLEAESTDPRVPAALWTALGVAQATPATEAPAFALPDLSGRLIRLANLRGRIVLLYFWATW